LGHRQRPGEKWAGFDRVGDLAILARAKGRPIEAVEAAAKLRSNPLAGRRYESRVEVRRDRISGFLDGKELVNWPTDFQEMSIDPMFVFPNPKALGVGIWWSRTTIHEISVREVTGRGRLLREAVPDAPMREEPVFANSLGMKFVPVAISGGTTDGKTILFSVWETRLRDYNTFASEGERERIYPSFPQDLDHPVVFVSRDDAMAFCKWLTERERKTGGIGPKDFYRLPFDHEWSCAVGLASVENADATPMEKSAKSSRYPWGLVYPPPPGTGNFYGEETRSNPFNGWSPIPGYQDGFARTAPVGSFAPNRLGLYDMDGNARESCLDWAVGNPERYVVRGGSWGDGKEFNLRSAIRYPTASDDRRDGHGFRCALERGNKLAIPNGSDGRVANWPRSSIPAKPRSTRCQWSSSSRRDRWMTWPQKSAEIAKRKAGIFVRGIVAAHSKEASTKMGNALILCSLRSFAANSTSEFSTRNPGGVWALTKARRHNADVSSHGLRVDGNTQTPFPA